MRGVQIAFAYKQPLAQHFVDSIHRKPFGEVAVLCDQDFADVIGMIQKINILRVIAKLEANDVAMASLQISVKQNEE